MIRDTLDAIRHILWPARCASCDILLQDPDASLCDVCRSSVAPAGRLNPPESIDEAWAFFYYEGAVQSLISRWKYHEDYASRRAILACVANDVPDLAVLLSPPFSVVPVPPHPNRLRERGFDPVWTAASRLARLLSLHFDADIPHADGCLCRTRHTVHQAGLSASERARNLLDAFQTQGPVPESVILVDDVMTTGATLTACAAALRDSGTKHLVSVTLACTRAG